MESLNLLYKGSENGFSADTFHEKVDDNVNVLTLIRTSAGALLGSFITSTELPASCKDGGWPRDAFIFYSPTMK